MSLPIEDLEGVGEIYGDQLRGAGIATTNDMLVEGPLGIANTLEWAISQDTLERWYGMCRLMLIDGLGPQEAEALTDAERGSWHTMDDTSPANLRGALEEAQEQGKIPDVPSEAAVARWQRAAVRLQYTGMVLGRIRTSDGDPIAGASVTVGDEQVLSDSSGAFVLAGIPMWEKELRVEKDGYFRLQRPLDVAEQKELRVGLTLRESPNGAKSNARASEWDGQIVAARPGDRRERLDVTPSDLPDDTPMAEYRRNRYTDGLIRLVSLYKLREGRTITTYRVKVTPDEIQGGAPEGRIVWKRAGGLEVGEESVWDYRRSQSSAMGGAIIDRLTAWATTEGETS